MAWTRDLWWMIMAWLVVVACLSGAAGQRAPCYECEMYKDSHPHSNPYAAIRAHCVYPCGCGSVPDCPSGVPVIQDGCGCCWQCARQAGETCNGATLCDSARGLTCHYESSAEPVGTCREKRAAKCSVNDTTYDDGETFALDCRTQCTCQNGTYACVSLCPGENIPPSEQCHHPHLVAVPGQCCREWMCDADPGKAVGPPECEQVTGRWSECSVQTCGSGVSVRPSTDQTNCQPINQSRLCQIRPCASGHKPIPNLASNIRNLGTRKHHIRRGHTCKATQRHVKSVRLRAGWCISERRYKPKYCNSCSDRCCTVHASTTITVPFLCPLHANTNLLRDPRHYYHVQDGSSDRQMDNKNNPPVYIQAPPSIATTTTTHSANPYEMMDEGQPISDSVLSYPSPSHYRYWFEDELAKEHKEKAGKSSSNRYGDGDYQVNKDADEDELLEDVDYQSENLTVESDEEYNEIKRDNYKVVHYQVEWILRCKCSSSPCPDQNSSSSSSSSKGDNRGT